MRENKQTLSRAIDLLQSEFDVACRALFIHYHTLLQKSQQPPEPSHHETLAMVGATGDELRISIAMRLPPPLLAATFPHDLHSGEENNTADWSGELANQLMGRFKNKLVGYNLTTIMDLPKVVKGHAMKLKFPKTSVTKTFNYISEKGHIEITLSLLLEQGFLSNFNNTVMKERRVAIEGDMLFF